MAKTGKQVVIDAIVKEIEKGNVRIKDIPGYEGHYKVTDTGVVLSCKFNLIKPLLKRKDKDGYTRVSLSINNKPKGFMIHRLVALAFIYNPFNLPCVNHKNEIKDNNSYTNLEWCSVAYNNNYGMRNKSVSIKKSKEVIQKTISGNELKRFPSITIAAIKTGMCRSKIGMCCNKQRLHTGGYAWSFVN